MIACTQHYERADTECSHRETQGNDYNKECKRATCMVDLLIMLTSSPAEWRTAGVACGESTPPVAWPPRATSVSLHRIGRQA